MSNLVARLTNVRDESHRLLSQMVDELRAYERDTRDAVAAAASAAEDARKAERLALEKQIGAARDVDLLRGELAAAAEARSALESSAAKRVASLEVELAATEPARVKAEEQAASLVAEMAAAERRVMEVERRLAVNADKLAVAELARSEAERHEGMFRRALFTYLQERDGPAGVNAPTPETLKQIRELLMVGS